MSDDSCDFCCDVAPRFLDLVLLGSGTEGSEAKGWVSGDGGRGTGFCWSEWLRSVGFSHGWRDRWMTR